MKRIFLLTAVVLTGCVVQPPTRTVYLPPLPPPPAPYYPPPPVAPPDVYTVPAPQPVVSIYVEPPLYQPPPIRVAWAPPPMLVEVPPPIPYFGAIWTGGYWVWEGNWVWARGRWIGPPQPGYAWVHPYYEHRGGSVIFVNGFWAAPGVTFVAPSLSLNIGFAAVSAGVVIGPRPVGPEGVFIPPPPGSYAGLIVPAPIGTAPAVVTGAPPIIRTGMRVNIVNNNTTVNNITNVTNVNNVTIVAPASATANGQAVNTAVPAQPHMAAALPPVVRALAPEPASAKPIPAFVPGRAPVVLPAAQVVRADMAPGAMRLHAAPTAPMVSPLQNVATNAAKPSTMPATAVASNGLPSDTAKRLASDTAVDPEHRRSKSDVARGPTGVASSPKVAKSVSASKPASKPVDAGPRKPEQKKPDVKKPDVKKPVEGEKTADKHKHE